MAVAVVTPGAVRCRECELYLPRQWYEKAKCPLCGEDLDVYTRAAVSPRWANRVWIATGHWPRGYPDVTRAETTHPPDTSAVITAEAGVLWVSELTLLELGYVPIAFLVVRLNERLYELQGRDWPRLAWWIELVGSELVVPDTIPLEELA